MSAFYPPAFSILLLLNLCQSQTVIVPANYDPCRRPSLYGHRGTTIHAPENTLPGFVWAMENGADGLETDLQSTVDGEIILFHDTTVGRITGDPNDRAVAAMTYAEISELNACGDFCADGPVSIPRLSDLIDAIGRELPARTRLILEIKDRSIVDRVAKIIENANLENQTIFAAFGNRMIRKIREIAPNSFSLIYVGLEKNIKNARPSGADFLKVSHVSPITPHIVQTTLANGFGAVVGGRYIGLDYVSLVVSDDVAMSVAKWRMAYKKRHCPN